MQQFIEFDWSSAPKTYTIFIMSMVSRAVEKHVFFNGSGRQNAANR